MTKALFIPGHVPRSQRDTSTSRTKNLLTSEDSCISSAGQTNYPVFRMASAHSHCYLWLFCFLAHGASILEGGH